MTGWGIALGGGGPVGAAWYAGLADGLLERDLDLRQADIIVGTSRRLAESGVGVMTVTPDDLEAQEFEFDLADITRIPVAIEAGRERGRREATRLIAVLTPG